jgi:prevent-host-death family protein
MPRNMSIAEAKAHLSVCIREAEQGESILITRHGKPVAALVAATHLEQFERLRIAGPQSGLASLAGGWDGSEELVDHIELSLRTEVRCTESLD